MNTFLILLLGYVAGRSETFHKKAREYWQDFSDGYNEGIKEGL